MAAIRESWVVFLHRTDKLAEMLFKAYSYYWRFTYRSLPGEWAIV